MSTEPGAIQCGAAADGALAQAAFAEGLARLAIGGGRVVTVDGVERGRGWITDAGQLVQHVVAVGRGLRTRIDLAGEIAHAVVRECGGAGVRAGLLRQLAETAPIGTQDTTAANAPPRVGMMNRILCIIRARTLCIAR